MGVFFGISTGDPLPSDAGLRSGAAQLRAAAQALNDRAASMRTVAATIGPGVWHDSASGRATTFINALADELVTGSYSLEESATALDNLAQYVSGQRFRYGEVTSELATTHHGIAADASALVREMRLSEEQRSIEGSVTAAMAHAADSINSAAAAASRYQYSPGHSLWSRVTDFLSGVGDGIYDTAKSLILLALEQAKLNPTRALIDPRGYLHDLEHLVQTDVATAEAIRHHPMALFQAFFQLGEMKRDPVHWTGGLISTMVLGTLSDGAGDAAKLADLQITSDVFTAERIDHIVYGGINGRGEATGFHVAKDGVPPPGRTIRPVGDPDPNGVYQAEVTIQNENGQALSKFSTMYPKSYSPEQAIRAAEEAFRNSITMPGNGSKWVGESNGGLKIEGYYGSGGTDTSSGGTGYPIYQPNANPDVQAPLPDVDLEILP